MDIPRIFNISESAYRIHDPFTPEKLAFFARRLSVQVDDQLDPRGKMIGVTVAADAFHFVMELPVGDHIDQLPENCASI